MELRTHVLEHVREHVVPPVLLLLVEDAGELRDERVDLGDDGLPREQCLELGEDDVAERSVSPSDQNRLKGGDVQGIRDAIHNMTVFRDERSD